MEKRELLYDAKYFLLKWYKANICHDKSHQFIDLSNNYNLLKEEGHIK